MARLLVGLLVFTVVLGALRSIFPVQPEPSAVVLLVTGERVVGEAHLSQQLRQLPFYAATPSSSPPPVPTAMEDAAVPAGLERGSHQQCAFRLCPGPPYLYLFTVSVCFGRARLPPALLTAVVCVSYSPIAIGQHLTTAGCGRSCGTC